MVKQILDLAKVTSKGQVVIPIEIRKDLQLNEGASLVVSRVGNMVVMKKMNIPDIKKEFEKLTRFGEKFARKNGIKNEDDVDRMIHRGRGIKSA